MPFPGEITIRHPFDIRGDVFFILGRDALVTSTISDIFPTRIDIFFFVFICYSVSEKENE